MFIYCISYHLWGVLGLSVVVVSIDSHSENPRFPVQLVDRYFMKLGVEELGVGELAGAGAFQDALQ